MGQHDAVDPAEHVAAATERRSRVRLPRACEVAVFVKLERGVAGVVEVHLRQPEAITQPHITVDPDVSLAEMRRALFESGAAVQLADNDFLLSHDWLLRNAAAAVDDADGWARELDVLLHSPSARSWYVKPVDAVRGAVIRTPVA